MNTENNQNSSQSTGTPTVDNKDVKGGKTFTQEDVDKLIAKRVSEEAVKNQDAINQAVENALAEERRKAQLTAEEREKEARSKREKELQDRENDVTLRERRIQAQELLQDKKIPIDLVDFVVDLDEAKTKDNIDKLAKTYNKSVETGVTDKLKGTPPTDFSNSNTNNEADKSKKNYSAF